MNVDLNQVQLIAAHTCIMQLLLQKLVNNVIPPALILLSNDVTCNVSCCVMLSHAGRYVSLVTHCGVTDLSILFTNNTILKIISGGSRGRWLSEKVVCGEVVLERGGTWGEMVGYMKEVVLGEMILGRGGTWGGGVLEGCGTWGEVVLGWRWYLRKLVIGGMWYLRKVVLFFFLFFTRKILLKISKKRRLTKTIYRAIYKIYIQSTTNFKIQTLYIIKKLL